MIFIFKVLYKLTNPYFSSERIKKGKKIIPKHHHREGAEMQITPKVLSCRSRAEERNAAVQQCFGFGVFCGVFGFYTKDPDSNPVSDRSGQYGRTEALKLWPAGPLPEGCGVGGRRSKRQYMGVFQESTCPFRLQRCRTINYTSVLQKISSVTAGGAIHQP